MTRLSTEEEQETFKKLGAIIHDAKEEYDHKEHFKTKLENYMIQCAYDKEMRKTYIEKLLRDKQHSQKLLYAKANNRVIEIELLREMLGKEK